MSAAKSFSTTAPPPRSVPRPAKGSRQARAAERAAELMCLRTEQRAVLRLQRAWRARAARLAARKRRKTQLVLREVQRKLDAVDLEVSQIFRALDADRSGTVDYMEFRGGLMQLGVEPLTDEEFGSFAALVDRDGDGDIERSELSAVLEYRVLTSADAFGAMSTMRSLGGFRVLGLPQGFEVFESSFVPDGRVPTVAGASHYRNADGCHLFREEGGRWVFSTGPFDPAKVSHVSGYLRSWSGGGTNGLDGWGPRSKQSSEWRWRIGERYHDIELAFRYEAVAQRPPRRAAPADPEQTGLGEEAQPSSFFDESMALALHPTARACWGGNPRPAAPTTAGGDRTRSEASASQSRVGRGAKRRQAKARRVWGQARRDDAQQKRREAGTGVRPSREAAKPLGGRPRGRESLLLGRRR